MLIEIGPSAHCGAYPAEGRALLTYLSAKVKYFVLLDAFNVFFTVCNICMSLHSA